VHFCPFLTFVGGTFDLGCFDFDFEVLAFVQVSHSRSQPTLLLEEMFLDAVSYWNLPSWFWRARFAPAAMNL